MVVRRRRRAPRALRWPPRPSAPAYSLRVLARLSCCPHSFPLSPAAAAKPWRMLAPPLAVVAPPPLHAPANASPVDSFRPQPRLAPFISCSRHFHRSSSGEGQFGHSSSAARHARRWPALMAGAPPSPFSFYFSLFTFASTSRISRAPYRPPPWPAPAGHRAPAPLPRHARRRAQCRARLATCWAPPDSPCRGECVGGGLVAGHLADGEISPVKPLPFSLWLPCGVG
jgi:hypothetical protein